MCRNYDTMNRCFSLGWQTWGHLLHRTASWYMLSVHEAQSASEKHRLVFCPPQTCISAQWGTTRPTSSELLPVLIFHLSCNASFIFHWKYRLFFSLPTFYFLAVPTTHRSFWTRNWAHATATTMLDPQLAESSGNYFWGEGYSCIHSIWKFPG